MTRLNRILTIVLVGQLIVAALVLLPRTIKSGNQEAGPLIPDLEADEVVSLTITDGQDSVHLVKQDESWVFAATDGFPTQEGSVADLLDKIAALKTNRLVTETAGSHKRLKVATDEFERLVDLELEDGRRFRLYIGSSPSFGVSHVRLEGQDQVYLASDLSAQDAQPTAAAWAERLYFSVPQAEVTALTLENGNGRFEFQREGETWTLAGLEEGESLDEGTFRTLLSRAASVALLAPLGQKTLPEYGLDQPAAVVRLQTADKSYTLTVGAQDAEDKSYVVRSSESPYYVRVKEFAVKDLVETSRDDLLQKPTPTPALTPTPEPLVYPSPTPGS